MHDAELRIKVAELAGARWKCLHAASHATLTFSEHGTEPNREYCEKDPAHPVDTRVPYYPNDLNAMHELEATLTDAQWDRYEYLLGIAVGQLETGWRKRFVRATARQRAETYVAVMESKVEQQAEVEAKRPARVTVNCRLPCNRGTLPAFRSWQNAAPCPERMCPLNRHGYRYDNWDVP